MKRTILSFFCLLCMTLAASATDRNGVKRQLTRLFNEAEQCYLIDDYQQLESCITQYVDTLDAYMDIIDSTEIFKGYYYKMCGAYYYGFAEDPTCANYSEYSYRKSLDVFNNQVRTKTIKGMHANAVTLHQELAQLYYKTGSYPMSKAQLDTVFTYYDGKLMDGMDAFKPSYYRTMSQLAMCNARLGYFEEALSQIDQAISDYYKKQKKEDYFEALRKKGKILMLQADSLGTTHYKKAVDCYRQYVNERYTDIDKEMNGMNESQRNQYWLATHQFLYDCCRLGNHAPDMLYDLALFSKDYLIRKNASRTKWEQVRQALGKNDCAIEFMQYYGRGDEKRLGCLVLHHQSKKPQFVDLFATDSLLNLPVSWLYTIGETIISYDSFDKDDLYNNKELPLLIWNENLMSAIGDAGNIYFSPDGFIHQLAIEYLMPDTTKTCYRLSSTRQLLQKRPAPKMERALLCGGIEYDANIHPNNKNNDVVAYRFLAPQTTTIKYLPGTMEEVTSIYNTRTSPNDTLIEGKTATDESFLKLLKQDYNVIHLATHGYFGGRIGIYTDIKPLLNDDSMSKSGLLFAGSANTLTDKNFDENLFDGVLSAEELSKQDLSKTELIVLSACQTGLGHLTEDGIYGIQRGLKMAGANAMIVSLWNVNDYSGSLLMRYFYEELDKQTTKDIHTAFMTARQRLLKQEETTYSFDPGTLTIRKETIRYNYPQHVNPFIIIDAY